MVSERLPSKQTAIKLLKQNGCTPRVIQHCRAVARLAVKIAKALQQKGYKIDVELVETGALLHDIGRGKTHTVHHALAGGKIARDLSLPESIVSIIERHVGGGIPADEAAELGWPRRSFMPQTLEERIVNYADKLIEGTHRVSMQQTINDFSRKMGKNHPSVERLKALDKEFQILLGEFKC